MELKLNTYSGAIIGKDVWFANNSFNGLFKMDIHTGEIHFVSIFPEEDGCYASYKKCIAIEKKIFFFPAYAKNIQIFDTTSEKFTTIKIEMGKVDFCADALLVGKVIYIFPADKSKNLLRMNVDTYEISEIKEFQENIPKLGMTSSDYLLCRVSEKLGKAYFAIYKSDMIVCYDLFNNEIKTYHTEINDIFACYIWKDKCYITTCNTSDIYVYDFINAPSKLYGISESFSQFRMFNNAFEYKNRLWFLPAFASEMVAIDINNKVYEYGKIERKENEKVAFFGAVATDNELCILPFDTSFSYIVDKDLSFKKAYTFELTDDKTTDLIISTLSEENGNILLENDVLSLDNFIKYIS